MMKDRNNKFFSFKGLLVVLIPLIFIVVYMLYITQDIKTSDKWFALSELINFYNYSDKPYMYCTSYNNIQNEKIGILMIVSSLICFIIALIIAFVILLSKNKNKNSNFEKTSKVKTNDFSFEENNIELKIQHTLSEKLKHDIYNVFCELQTASMNFDYNTLEKLLTSDLYLKYRSSLEILKSKNKQNIFECFEFIDAEFIDFDKKDDKYLIKVNLKIRFYGYLKDISKDKVIKGTKEQKIIETYALNLIKYSTCSNCSASINENLNYCEHCKSDSLKIIDNWLIENKEKVK